MDIQSESVIFNQAKLQEQAAVQVQAMGLSAMKQQGEALAKLMESAQIINDPNLGRVIDLSA